MEGLENISYNTQRDDMVIPEYGRNVQNMIGVALSIENKEERNRCAQAIIKVMGQLNPHLRDVEDFNHKLWAHLFVMSNFELDVDSPYPVPTKESFTSKPDLVDYPQRKIRYGHYGRIAEDWIEAASKMEDGEEKNVLIKRLANMLKASYLIWNKDAVDNAVIVKNLSEMSNGKLTISEEMLTDTTDILKNIKRPNTSIKRKNKRRKNNK
ncbi:MAG: DUF4290 domain-containing protein [Flavobacteriales bacterium]|nr:DUF4290 domain-containing protein [Flavobacteriales bacterium]